MLTLKLYWLALKSDMESFCKQNKLEASSDKDFQTYLKCMNFLETMLRLGQEIENTSYTLLKTNTGLKLKELPQKTFGAYQTLDEIPGRLTFEFVQQVYLPHLRRFRDVTFDDQNYSLRLFTNLDSEKQTTKELVRKLEAAINYYTAQTLKLADDYASGLHARKKNP